MTKRSPQRVATTYDVARLAGVSQSAVSRAFTDGASVSAKMRDKILQAADELGFRPNILARGLTKKTKIVGVVCGDFDNPFFSTALDRLAAMFAVKGMRILLFPAEPDTSADAQVSELLSYKVTSVILMAVSLSSDLAAECEAYGIPVVMFNRTALASRDAFAVTGNNVAGGEAIARHFLATGRKRMAFIAGYPLSSTSAEREHAFMHTLSAAGAGPVRRVVGGYAREGAVAATRELLDDRAAVPDAIFCANDFMAIAVIETLRAEFGLRPGVDCAVAGFDNIPMASWPSFSLTTYSQPIEAMVSEVERFVDGPESGSARHVIVDGELIIRQSA
ncbi:LacI family DNA-binding transcriptional regulator [Sphingobium sp. H39-3-25]|uniref:LacI family DNA-binding transcriptional regulator n=1 Tax=Sphingobium arseniciresistens TaxID=3030834 RepID=UPI0023BA33F3|nr:LacI family DNA-binding transcriptional regulator [Sphingobium arseniciresistens]